MWAIAMEKKPKIDSIVMCNEYIPMYALGNLSLWIMINNERPCEFFADEGNTIGSVYKDNSIIPYTLLNLIMR